MSDEKRDAQGRTSTICYLEPLLFDPPNTQTPLSATDLSKDPQPLDWIVRGVIPRGGKCILAASSGSHKSWLALDLALCIAAGKDWLGRSEFAVRHNRGPVILADEDSPRGSIPSRLVRLAGGHGWSLKDPWWTRRIRLYESQGITILQKWTYLVTEAINWNASLVVLDAAQNFLAGSDEDAGDVGAFFSAVHELQHKKEGEEGERDGTAVLIIHHAGWKEKGRLRGTSRWRDQTDVELNLQGAKGSGERTLAWNKTRDEELHDPLKLRFVVGESEAKVECDGVCLTLRQTCLKERETEAETIEILVAVRQAGAGDVTISSVVERFKGTLSRATIYRRIEELKEVGELVAGERRGTVRIPVVSR